LELTGVNFKLQIPNVNAKRQTPNGSIRAIRYSISSRTPHPARRHPAVEVVSPY
jgi:hypothetical protein